jgi:hypothetical protein
VLENKARVEDSTSFVDVSDVETCKETHVDVNSGAGVVTGVVSGKAGDRVV